MCVFYSDKIMFNMFTRITVLSSFWLVRDRESQITHLPHYPLQPWAQKRSIINNVYYVGRRT